MIFFAKPSHVLRKKSAKSAKSADKYRMTAKAQDGVRWQTWKFCPQISQISQIFACPRAAVANSDVRQSVTGNRFRFV